MRLIDADALLKSGLRVSYGYVDDGNVVLVPMADVYKSIREAPTIDDAITLPREQEPQETRLMRHYSGPGVYADLWLYCEKCGGKVGDGFYRPKFCPECGRRVKLDETD